MKSYSLTRVKLIVLYNILGTKMFTSVQQPVIKYTILQQQKTTKNHLNKKRTDDYIYINNNQNQCPWGTCKNKKSDLFDSKNDSKVLASKGDSKVLASKGDSKVLASKGDSKVLASKGDSKALWNIQ